jgi:hypothetical protein
VAGEVNVGFDDAVMLLAPEPHIPVSPDVSGIAEDIVSPDVGEIAVDIDIPDGATPPDVAAVAGVVIPFAIAIAIPPPS